MKQVLKRVCKNLLNIPASGNHDSGTVETNIPDTETTFDWLN